MLWSWTPRMGLKTMTDKFIYSDVDECVVKWFPNFSNDVLKARGYKVIDPSAYYIHHHFDVGDDIVHELIQDYHASGALRHLPPIDDSVHFLRRICEDFGYKIVFITACGDYSQKCREYEDRYHCLKNLFGKENIHNLHCVSTSSKKLPILKKYNDTGSLWIDDNIENVEMGILLGYESYIYESPFNKHYEGLAPRIKSWKHVYNIISKKEAV